MGIDPSSIHRHDSISRENLFSNASILADRQRAAVCCAVLGGSGEGGGYGLIRVFVRGHDFVPGTGARLYLEDGFPVLLPCSVSRNFIPIYAISTI